MIIIILRSFRFILRINIRLIRFENKVHHLILKNYFFIHQAIYHDPIWNIFQTLEPLVFRFLSHFKLLKNKLMELILGSNDSILKNRIRCNSSDIVRLKKNLNLISKLKIVSYNEVSLNNKKYEYLLISLKRWDP